MYYKPWLVWSDRNKFNKCCLWKRHCRSGCITGKKYCTWRSILAKDLSWTCLVCPDGGGCFDNKRAWAWSLLQMIMARKSRTVRHIYSFTLEASCHWEDTVARSHDVSTVEFGDHFVVTRACTCLEAWSHARAYVKYAEKHGGSEQAESDGIKFTKTNWVGMGSELPLQK